jgi:ribosomal protein L11 methyltransferase
MGRVHQRRPALMHSRVPNPACACISALAAAMAAPTVMLDDEWMVMVDLTTRPWLELIVRCDADAVDTVAEVFSIYDFTQGVDVQEADPHAVDGETFAVEPGKLVTVRTALNAGDVVPEQLEEIRDDLWNLRQSLWVRSRTRPIGALEIIERPEEDWGNAWKSRYTVYRVGHRVFVKAPWQEYVPAADEIVVELDPGRVFGIGYHSTTQLSMEALEEEIKAGDHVLDVGTGSGILATAAALLGACAVDAVDIEPVAVRLARENAARNGVSEVVRVTLGSIGPGTPFQGTYDLVMTNIIAPVLIELAPALVRAVAPRGTLILSGMLEEKEKAVYETFVPENLALDRRTEREGWVTLVWRKPK